VSGRFAIQLDAALGAVLLVEFTTLRRAVTDYSVVLAVEHESERVTVRVYDGAHGRNEMHRYTRAGGKQAAETLHSGTLGEGMRAAMTAIREGYEQMIDAWSRT
jgi:hypothetical protein